MAGDWIKLRSTLDTDPSVIATASALKLDEFSVVGRLHKFWSWVDAHSPDGFLHGISDVYIDRLVNRKGFSQALRAVGWLAGGNGVALHVPRFERHNGRSAKARAGESERKRLQRLYNETPKCTDTSGHLSGQMSTKSTDQRREEKSIKPPKPPDESAAFAAFWSLYPKKVNKAGSASTFAKVKASECLELVIFGLERDLQSDQWSKDRGQYIPHPKTWLNERRWESDLFVPKAKPVNGSV